MKNIGNDLVARGGLGEGAGHEGFVSSPLCVKKYRNKPGRLTEGSKLFAFYCGPRYFKKV